MSPEDVRAARVALGLTQAELASELELSGSTAKDTVRSWESGKRPISGPARVALRLLVDRKRASRPANLAAELDQALEHADRLVEDLNGRSGRTIAKETRDRIAKALESAAMLDRL